jgi:hypothetical protein
LNGFDGLDFGAHEHGIHLAVGPDRMHLMLEGLGLAILGWTTIQVTKAGIFNKNSSLFLLKFVGFSITKAASRLSMTTWRVFPPQQATPPWPTNGCR